MNKENCSIIAVVLMLTINVVCTLRLQFFFGRRCSFTNIEFTYQFNFLFLFPMQLQLKHIDEHGVDVN